MYQTIGQFFRYGIVGVLSNAVGYLLYLGMTGVGIGPKVAMTLLYAIGVAQTFVFNKRWTFRHQGHLSIAFVRYIAAYGFGYFLNLFGLLLLVDHMGLPHQLVQGAMILTLAVMLFLAQKFWVFKPLIDVKT
ncbi:GtrA family protein [Candidatus Thiodictyon syntrophicum]|uniref:Polysaccharide synthesis protein GtrA n=1 Tax=Candidatus Thiodictyon syntrophicum TaxID=1166950 RepID=A0A2K8UD71_9GAMM|nr:GtrA family protein [Candidatus Thiodictyon syntrophicum]AUB83522.1 polysaccharide synthesis protein GtrA [Candidatus Thiodictyon syntrophicum]